MKVLDFYTVVNLQCTWILCIHVTYVIFLHTILPFRHLRKRLAPTLHKSTTPFFPDSELAWEDDEVDRNTRETPLTRIYHTDIARSRFRIAYRDAREGGRECRATQVRATWSDFLLISPFSPADRFRIREFGLSAEEAPQRRRRRRARIWSRKAGEVLTFHDGARPPRPPRIPLFAGHESRESKSRDRCATLTDPPDSRVAAVLWATVSERGPYTVHRTASRASASTLVRNYEPPHPLYRSTLNSRSPDSTTGTH